MDGEDRKKQVADPGGDSVTTLANDPVEVIHGDAAPEEVAALVAVLVAHHSRRVPPTGRRVSGWTDHRHAVRSPVRPGLGAWQSSLR